MQSTATATQIGGASVVRVEPDPPHVIGDEARNRLHQEMLTDMEHHSPEGEEVHSNSKWIWVLVASIQLVLITAGIVGLWLTAGRAAAGVGAVMVLGLYLIGVAPQWNAARIRWREQQEFEQTILNRIERMERRVAMKCGETIPPSHAATHPRTASGVFGAIGERPAAHYLVFASLVAVMCVIMIIVL